MARINALVIQRDALEEAIDREVVLAKDLGATYEAIGIALGGAGEPQIKQTAAARHKRASARQRGR
ncbi:MAG: hypothetical protein QOI54_155 [Actinomycetota bacterium]|nr:hypothetical protein [Actinomycetota bacterium]